MLRLVRVARLERVAVLVRGAFQRLLGPGLHPVWGAAELIRYSLAAPLRPIAFGDPIPAEAEGQRVVEVSATERALVLVDGQQDQVLGPGRYRVWEGVAQVELRRYDLLARPQPLADEDRILVGAGRVEATATADMAVVLLRDGLPVEELAAGRYRTWSSSPWSLARVDRGLRGLEVAAQDLVTSDQISVRVKPAVAFRVSDPIRFLAERTQAGNQVYVAVQLALREIVSTRLLEALLGDREALGRTLLEESRARLPEVGLAIAQAAVKDVVLPGDVKDLLAKVTLARKEAEALAIRRREEVAATRQLANTAKLLEKNPVLTRLKELEALGELVSRIDRLTVVGAPSDWVPRLLSGATGALQPESGDS